MPAITQAIYSLLQEKSGKERKEQERMDFFFYSVQFCVDQDHPCLHRNGSLSLSARTTQVCDGKKTKGIMISE